MWVDPNCHHKCPYKIQAGRDLTQRRGEGDVFVKAEIGGMQPQAKGCQQSGEPGRGRRWILLQSLWRGCDPTNTWRSVQ